MEKLSSFWDFIANNTLLDHSLINLGVRCTLSFRRMGDEMWKYRFTSSDGWVTHIIEGSIVLDVSNKTMIKQTIFRDTFGPQNQSRRDFGSVQFRHIARLFFDDAVIYTHLPSLKSISLESIKCKN